MDPRRIQTSMHRCSLLFALLVSGCATVRLEPIPLPMREVPVDDRRMNVTADLPQPVIEAIVHHFRARMSADVFGVWSVPDQTDRQIVFAEQPAADSVYGPQVFVVSRRSETVEVLHETARMMDTDFLDPAFFRGGARVLMLANFGSEDSWGLLALHLAPDPIVDLGIVDVVQPGTIDFTESALPVVEVFVERERYVLRFRGEVIESPTDAPTKWLAKKGERAVFREVDGRFVYGD